MNDEVVVIKREDLEYLKKGFIYLQEKNEELQEQIAALTTPEDLGIDLSRFEEMFREPEEDEEDEDYDTISSLNSNIN